MKSIIESVLSHPIYYLVMLISLIFLIFLFFSVRKRRYEREAEELRNKRQGEQKYVPKYAAGDEMDRVRKRSYFQQESNHPPMPLVVLVICATLAVCSYAKYPEATKNFFSRIAQGDFKQNSSQAARNLYQGTIAEIPPTDQGHTQPVPVGNLKDMEMNSVITFSSDYKQLFITTVFVNAGNGTLYNLIPTYTLINAEGETLQKQEGERIPEIKAGESLERITAIPLKVEASEAAQCLQSLRVG